MKKLICLITLFALSTLSCISCANPAQVNSTESFIEAQESAVESTVVEMTVENLKPESTETEPEVVPAEPQAFPAPLEDDPPPPETSMVVVVVGEHSFPCYFDIGLEETALEAMTVVSNLPQKLINHCSILFLARNRFAFKGDFDSSTSVLIFTDVTESIPVAVTYLIASNYLDANPDVLVAWEDEDILGPMTLSDSSHKDFCYAVSTVLLGLEFPNPMTSERYEYISQLFEDPLS